ncbi:MAG: NAD+ synthase [Ottowia sp.]|nr:NAD+ synthase [Ottowia sp.]
MAFRINTFQLNATLGDLPGNARKIVEAARAAHAGGARLLVTPELGVSGSPALDLLRQPDFVTACEAAVRHVAAKTADLQDLAIVLGHPARLQAGPPPAQPVASAVSVLRNGKIMASTTRQHLDAGERYYFAAGSRTGLFDVAGVPCAVLPGNDCDDGALLDAAVAAGAGLLLVVAAAPFSHGATTSRQDRLAAAARRAGRPLLYVNALGAQDGVVFDGAALALQPDGAVAAAAARWTGQSLAPVLAQDGRWQAASTPAAAAHGPDTDADLWQALVLGLRDYMGKNGLAQAAVGLSGGLDSALVLTLAVDALGPDNVRTLAMPGPFTADMSTADAHEMARRVRVRCDEVAIGPLFDGFRTALAPLFAGRAEDTTEENLQARIRGSLLMALSNKFGHMVLVTGNKSEEAVGYSTLYGDTCGGYAPISDVYKTDVFRLARWRNRNDPFARASNPIPQRIIDRPPSAELRAGQLDTDSLPPYDVLDAILAGHLEGGQSAPELVVRGFDAATVARVMRLLRTSEYKRRQAAPGTRVSHCSFDRDRRWPLSHGYVPELPMQTLH